jgi:hypothetical protein
MYCASCGKDIVEGLRFCNRCGAQIGDDTDPNALAESSFNALVGALLTIPIVGIGLILGLLVVMKRELGFADDAVMVVVFLSFLLLTAAEGGFIWLMLSRTRRKKKKVMSDVAGQPQLNEASTKTLSEGQPLGFGEAAPSVTEHTTRTLDPVRRDRGTK